MIDTICLKIPFSHVDCDDNEYLFSVKIPYLSYGVASRVDTSQHTGIYVPAMVVKKYQYKDCSTKPHSYYDAIFFYITLSIPKLFYGENLSEVHEKNFKEVVKKLQDVMSKCGIYIKEEYIESAEIREVHFSKNIILRHTTTAKVLQILSSGHINKLHTKYKEYVNKGQQVSFNSGTNSLTFYNKTVEIKHNCSKLKHEGELRESQAQAWLKAKNLQILRIEVKLKNVKKIKDLCSKLELLPKDELNGTLKFKTLFKEKIAKGVVLDYFQKVYYGIVVPEKESLNLIVEKILEDKSLLTGRKFSNIGVICCLLHFGRDRTVNVCYKKVLEAEKLIREIRKNQERDEEFNPLDEVYNQIERFDLIYGLESGQLTEEDEDIIGYRKRAFTAEEKEAICGQALNKHLPQSEEGYRRVLREMLEVNGGKSLPETNEEALILYHEYKGVQREKELQRIRGESGEVSGVILNSNFTEKKKKSSKDKEESLDETRKWIEEKFQNNLNDSQKELKNAEPKKKKERKKREEQKPKKENISKNEVKDEITLLTPEEMFPDDPYRLEMYYHEQKIAKETPEQRKAREDVIAEQERKIREIERTARNIKIYDGPREELKVQQAGSKEILNPNYRERRRVYKEISDIDVILNPNFRENEEASEIKVTESLSDKSQYNDTS